MDFLRYAERAATMVNASLEDEDDVRAQLADRPWLAERVSAADVRVLRRLRRDLRPVFAEAPEAGESADRVVERLNELLARHPVSPFITGHGGQGLHLHVAERRSSVAETLATEGLMGLSTVVCDLGPDRLGECQADRCGQVFVDTSPNCSRRYCSDRCSSRANVAAFRARRRAAAAP
ncbi:CGNR zinc finger domain-containing protein [Actinopolymorpha rutila]|uniref:Putative RNA-binding Zn ribbon-like protein n=1 Tax=Actinopolymorpha rutila TaxID=446787 RepID=A0A852ZFF2_9ACTN|nr:putative RNA-binding Zn ribbon-like protein [Actinopolymorpha rutila]